METLDMKQRQWKRWGGGFFTFMKRGGQSVEADFGVSL